jgi:hypothetical protein
VNGNKIKMFYNPHGFSFLMQDDSKSKRIMYWTIEKIIAIFNRKCTIIGCSKGEYEEALKLTKNAVCINNGINVEKLKKDIKNLNKKEIDFNNLKICTSGRIGYQKNPKLFNEIAQEFPNIKFTWIGDGDLKSELSSSNITVTGWKSREEVLRLVNENDIFILTSLWEGLPISLLEAMWLGKICIVTNCIGNRDVIENKINGYIITEENYKDIIKNLYINDYKKIIENGKNSVLKKYNSKIMCEEYMRAYNK